MQDAKLGREASMRALEKHCPSRSLTEPLTSRLMRHVRDMQSAGTDLERHTEQARAACSASDVLQVLVPETAELERELAKLHSKTQERAARLIRDSDQALASTVCGMMQTVEQSRRMAAMSPGTASSTGSTATDSSPFQRAGISSSGGLDIASFSLP
jgi:hypothetical protein